jgi:trimethylamine--corrinoid protein Co-methyltransferase
MAAGVDISENAQAMDAIKEVGPGGHFLGCDHTQRNFKDSFWRSNIFDYKPFETWSEEGERDTVMLANNKIKEILSNYEKPPLDAGIEEALIEYIAKKKASLPDSLV